MRGALMAMRTLGELLIATLCFRGALPRPRFSAPRSSWISIFVIVAFAAAIGLLGSFGVSLHVSALGYALSFVVLWLLVWRRFAIAKLDALTICVLGYCLQHFASDLSFMVLLSRGLSSERIAVDPLLSLAYYGGFAIVYLIGYLLVGRSFSIDTAKAHSRVTWVLLCCSSVFFLIVFNLVFVTTQASDVRMVCYGYDLLCTALIFFIMLLVSRADTLESSLDVVERMWNQKRAQYELTKENIELINIKCHDIRRHIAHMERGDLPLGPEALREIENSVSVYDSGVHTGSAVLDVILTEKRLFCSQHDIELMCMADGSLLTKLEEDDLYFLMANVLENAIEATLSLSDPAQRIINLTVSREGPLVSIREENYCKGSLDLSSDGLPRTSKGDETNHGFGMRSIRHVAEKYGGTLSFGCDDDIFTLCVLIPLG